MTESAPAKRKPTKPPGLDKAGSRLWREVITSGAYDLRPDELLILEHCCRQQDLIASMQVELNDDLAEGLFKVKGSQGQDVINPLIDKITTMRSAVTMMVLKLRLPDEPAGEHPAENPRSVGARNAANARWGNSG